MAYAGLVSLEHTTHLILNHHKYIVSVVEREQITSIREYVSFLISFFDDLPDKANRLEGKIRDLAHEAEDLIEFHLWNQFQTNWPISVPFSFECQLKRVREEIGTITGEMMDDRTSDLPAAVSSSRVGVTGNNDVVIGFGDDRIAIMDRLCGSSKLEVIPIVGMGGIGKTTLAQHIYDDPLIVECFDIRVWVTVSQNYSVDEILQTLLDSIKVFSEEILGYKNKYASVAEKVYKTLKGRRYLIVMDDIWSRNVWDIVRNIFPDDKNGSRIMLTTRLSDVAAYASSGSPLHEMKFLDERHSWDLLKQKVFTDGQDCSPELEDIGKGIARGCRGLPLAVVLVAGVLSTMVKTRASWEKIAGDLNTVLIDEQFDKILSLSYMLLPHHLRPCFLFMAGFSEDHNIQVSRLVKLWVAEGFLRGRNGYNSLEEEAEDYLEDLVKRSLVLITRRRSNGKIKSCRLHDLVRDMCIWIAAEENFLLTVRHDLRSWSQDMRRVRVSSSLLDVIQSPTIHSILCIHPVKDSFSLDFVVNFRLLRVLEVILSLRNKSSVVFHPAVFELFHLRYLAVSITNDDTLQGISNLENLQTLILYPKYYASRYWDEVGSYLAVEIWRMQQLRHLVLPNGYGLPIPDGSTFPLNNLQTLSAVPSSVCKRIYQMIPNLKKLEILHVRKEHDLHNLANLQQLENLKIESSLHSWEGRYPVFPLTLKKLTLVGGELPWKDMSIVGTLPNLQVLKLRDGACYGDTWETSDGEFTQLKFLLIERLHFRNWISESFHFPRLKCLVLRQCGDLEEIPSCIGDIPTLELIDVTGLQYQESLVNSVKQIQDEQLNYGNDTLQVRCNKLESGLRSIHKLPASIADERRLVEKIWCYLIKKIKKLC